MSIGPDGIRFGETLHCFAMLAIASVPLSIALAAMLRYAAGLRPGRLFGTFNTEEARILLLSGEVEYALLHATELMAPPKLV